MADEKKRILVLQNVVLDTNNILQDKMNCNKDGLNSHDNNSIPNVRKRRLTASTYLFDEEPVFSDSDDEEKYCKNVLATQNCFNFPNKTSEKLDAEFRCNLSPDDLKIIEVINEVIKECACVNVANVNDDFKQLINLCKELEVKYIAPPTSGKILSEIVAANNGPIDNEVLSNKDLVSKNLANIQELIPTPEDQYYQVNFAPSRNGCAGAENNSFFSQMFSFDSGFSSVPSITKYITDNEEKENKVRRSSRIRKPVNINNSGIFVTRKYIKLLNRKRAQRKTENNVRSKQKNSSKKTNTTNILKQRTENKSVSNVLMGRNEEKNIKQQNFITKSIASNEEKENVGRKSTRIPKPVTIKTSGMFVTRKDLKLLNKSRQRRKTGNIVRVKQKNSSSKITNRGKNEERNTKQQNKNKSSLATVMKLKETVGLKDFQESIFHLKALYLPSKQVKSLARNWMKNKSVEKNKLADDTRSVSMQHKTRKLYSPHEWLHAQEFIDLEVKN
ncbi:uncharacterized protein LOC108909262 [Anoplophora glabripennis]|uniref:uncharacterized protein LOC108909262 n=1 Tax=Anoplophora glabripennis TaxID=217634 RepID=UPI000874770D|nr:uncharacterized protein LOC108909262 [Anoplophora glabripennis]XP_018569052.1 uncharacterized protein LOC108909262 [Anoplophora glabripennis]